MSGKKTNRTGRSDKAPRHIRLYHWMTDSPAWHDLNAVARAIYCDMARRYNGSNNGRIPYSIREAVDELHISRSTAHYAIRSLAEHGFTAEMKRGAFSLKARHATEWRLTEFSCDVTNSVSSKDFMRWQPGQSASQKPSHKKQNKSTPGELTSTPGEPYEYPRRTVNSEKGPDEYPRRTVEAKKSISRVPPSDTDSIPGKERSDAAGVLPGMGHNLGPSWDGDEVGELEQWIEWRDTWAALDTADDLTIPAFLRREPVAVPLSGGIA